jgi:hypothetical protein
MPLLPGNHPTIISHNIHEMVQAGHPERVAVAAALANADKHGDGEKQLKLKRPTLHAKHPFNSKKAPSNRARVPVIKTTAQTPLTTAGHPAVVAEHKMPAQAGMPTDRVAEDTDHDGM